MGGRSRGAGGDLDARVERVLRQCPAWSRSGRHRKVISTIDEHLPMLGEQPHLMAALLVWKAQALLALGHAEQAQVAASRSWELAPSPHACHLTANAEEALGNHDQAEDLLRVGWRLFPDSVHLPVQLAIILADQARVPEAQQVLEQIPLDARIPPDLQVFLCGMRSNLLAAMGRWAEADDLLQRGMSDHPQSNVLSDTHASLVAARGRAEAEARLAASWAEGLQALDRGPSEVDEAVIRCGAVNELPELVVLAARRLWRSYLEHSGARPHVPEAWGAALIAAVLELDGSRPPIGGFARSFGCSPSSVRRVLSRLRAFVDGLDREFAELAFAARSNPRIDEAGPRRPEPAEAPGRVVPFPDVPRVDS